MKISSLFVLFLVIETFAYDVRAAKILGIFHAPAYSHQILGHTLLNALAEKGHEITFITTLPPKEPIKNVKIVKLEFDTSQHEDARKELFKQVNQMAVTKLLWLDLMGLMMTELTLNQTSVFNLLKSDQHFDVVIIENFLNEAFRGFCHHYRAPCVMLSTVGSNRWTNAQMGNPGPPSYIPDMLADVPNEMNLLERTYNTIVYTMSELFFNIYTFPKHNELLQKYFPEAPHLNELYYNTSLMLLNSHSSTHQAVPLVSNMIEVGGFHVPPVKQLPEDLQEYLDKSQHGVVFFSMGSNLRSRDMPADKREAIVDCLSRLKYDVLWKWEDEKVPNQPTNVKIKSWLPQPDVLAHPNVKLFITHGGLLSMIEAVHSGVPLLGIPIFGDQQMNVARMKSLGLGVGIPYVELNQATFCAALNEVLENPNYMQNAKYRARVMHDQQVKPIDKAVFWVEYVIRHRGAPHLKSTALNLKWYEYLLLDVLVLVSVTLFVAWKLVKFSLSAICGTICSKQKTGKFKKNN